MMILNANIFAQNSFELTGNNGLNSKAATLLNSFEITPSNYSLLNDWGLTFSYGGEFANGVTSNIYLLSLSKRFLKNFVSLRYTPGYQKEFLFSTGQSIILDDSSTQQLKSKFSYKELFGIGYSCKPYEKLSAGFTLRYFTQEFISESINFT